MNAKLKAALASYARSVLSAAVALYISGVTDPVKLLAALAAGLIPVAIRYFNPKDPAFGKVAEDAIRAYLPAGGSVISQEYLDANKDAIDKLVKAYQASQKPVAKKPAVKKTTTAKK